MKVYIALAHYPVRNRNGEEVATAVTNLDIHDLARTARTYGVDGYTIVTPVAQQQSLVSRIIRHWIEGEGTTYNPVRAEAFRFVDVAGSVEETIDKIERESGQRPIVVATGAQLKENCLSFEALRERLETHDGSCLIVFGTGWGMTEEFLEACDYRLPGINAANPALTYNHLSVRAAVAIILDRLLGQQDS
jgi:hypothetical protein